MKNSIQIIIVLYGCGLSQSTAFTSLKKQLKKRKTDIHYDIIIFNNDTKQQINSSDDLTIINSTSNKKLAFAYNFALKRAIEQHREWLLLIDQDTEITDEYFTELENYLSAPKEKNVVSVVPFLVSHNRAVSPERIDDFIWKTHSITQQKGICTGRISAFNSMSLLKVDFIKKIGGFNEQYPLDMLDYWVYNQIYKRVKKVSVLNVKIEHNLSLLDKKKYIPLSRYKDLLSAENKFVKTELNLSHYLSHKLRLIYRVVYQVLKRKDKKYLLATIKMLFQ